MDVILIRRLRLFVLIDFFVKNHHILLHGFFSCQKTLSFILDNLFVKNLHVYFFVWISCKKAPKLVLIWFPGLEFLLFDYFLVRKL